MSPRPGPVANEQQTQTLSGNALVALVKPSTSSSNLSYYTAPIPADTQTNFALATPKTSLQHNQSPRNHQPAELPMVSNTEAFQSMKLSQISTDSSKSAPTEETLFTSSYLLVCDPALSSPTQSPANEKWVSQALERNPQPETPNTNRLLQCLCQ
uniref:Uncharacterized protein n=1 Tax=Ditylenchus dipsaci TaxID=166011 RepID=A0A915DST4_9BILA